MHHKLCSKRRKLLYTLEHHPVNQLGCQADLRTDLLFKQFCTTISAANIQNPAVSSAGTCPYIKEAYKVQYKPTGIENSMHCYPRKHSVNVCWLQTSAFHTSRQCLLYTSKCLVLPGDCFLPCLLTITGSFFGAKYGRLKRILPVCVLLSIIHMQFSGLALAWLHKAASTLNYSLKNSKNLKQLFWNIENQSFSLTHFTC